MGQLLKGPSPLADMVTDLLGLHEDWGAYKWCDYVDGTRIYQDIYQEPMDKWRQEFVIDYPNGQVTYISYSENHTEFEDLDLEEGTLGDFEDWLKNAIKNKWQPI